MPRGASSTGWTATWRTACVPHSALAPVTHAAAAPPAEPPRTGRHQAAGDMSHSSSVRGGSGDCSSGSSSKGEDSAELLAPTSDSDITGGNGDGTATSAAGSSAADCVCNSSCAMRSAASSSAADSLCDSVGPDVNITALAQAARAATVATANLVLAARQAEEEEEADGAQISPAPPAMRQLLTMYLHGLRRLAALPKEHASLLLDPLLLALPLQHMGSAVECAEPQVANDLAAAAVAAMRNLMQLSGAAVSDQLAAALVLCTATGVAEEARRLSPPRACDVATMAALLRTACREQAAEFEADGGVLLAKRRAVDCAIEAPAMQPPEVVAYHIIGTLLALLRGSAPALGEDWVQVGHSVGDTPARATRLGSSCLPLCEAAQVGMQQARSLHKGSCCLPCMTCCRASVMTPVVMAHRRAHVILAPLPAGVHSGASRCADLPAGGHATGQRRLLVDSGVCLGEWLTAATQLHVPFFGGHSKREHAYMMLLPERTCDSGACRSVCRMTEPPGFRQTRHGRGAWWRCNLRR